MSTTTFDHTSGRLIDESLFIGDGDSPALRGSRCDDCATVAFPAQRSCSKCTGDQVTDIALPTDGTLWAYTIQGFPPKEPYLKTAERPFRPYAVGYVNLGEILVESRIIAPDPDALATGDALSLVFEPIHGEGADTLYTFAFAPTSTATEQDPS